MPLAYGKCTNSIVFCTKMFRFLDLSKSIALSSEKTTWGRLQLERAQKHLSIWPRGR